MSYLLDTHVLLWMLDETKQLPTAVREVLEDRTNRLFISTASIWELAIKINLGKMTLSRSLASLVDSLPDLNITLVPVKAVHVLPVETLRLHHRDPFDRLIIACAMVEGHTIISKDPVFDYYPIAVLWE